MARKSKSQKRINAESLLKQYRKLRFELKEKGGVLRNFELSRIKFRELAHKGQIPGVKKSSW